MKTQRPDGGNDGLDRALDRACDEIRTEQPDAAFEREATSRVWQQLSGEAQRDVTPAPAPRISSCADFQAMLPDYLVGRLSQARLLLLEDHLGECVPCRRALKERRTAARPRIEPRRATQRSLASTWGWRAAAAAAIFVTFVGFSIKTDVFSFESGGLIRIEAIDGELFQVTGEGATPLKIGDQLKLGAGDSIRTSKDSSAILTLADNSQVEMRERSQLAVLQRKHLLPGRKADGLLDLDRGSIIVEASDQGSGHLYVDTQDCNVAVTGTVFAVTSGTKGSRVSVVEGEVHVDYRGNKDVLQSGQQTTTRSILDHVPVEEDIAWSRNREEYVALLAEMREIGRELDEVLRPGLRYDTDLLDIAPAGTLVYFAMPNISDELGEAYELLQDRVSTSVVLKSWWEEQILASGEGSEIEKAIEHIRRFGDNLGQEVVMTVQTGVDGQVAGPLFLARLNDPGSFAETFVAQVAELEAMHGEKIELTLLGERLSTTAPAGGANDGAYLWTQGDVLAMTPHYESLWALEAALQGHAETTIAGGEFHDRLARTYRGGVEWVVGVDIERLMRLDSEAEAKLEDMGLLDIQHLIGERKVIDDRTENRAELTFAQDRRRMAAWIAEPAAMGALDYIGPDANLAAAFVMKDMGVIVDELFEMIGAEDANFDETLAEFEAKEGIDFRRDVVGPLGGEIALALDGPMLPTPSWKVVIEVYDPARLTQTIEWFVERIKRGASDLGQPHPLEFAREMFAGREYFRLESVETGIGFHFVFDGNYMVAGPTRALLDRALQNRDAGIRLTDSRTFIDMLPQDGEINFSGMVYQNMAPVLDPLASTLETVGGLADEQQQFVNALAAEAKPSLALLYGHHDRITLASSAEGGLFSSMINQLSGASGLLGMQQSLTRAVEQAHGR